jgi:cob(I)alamin adenosyltransferase
MSQFYTRTGDNGFTGVLGEGRIPKNHPRLEAIGTVDEASAGLGLARATCQASETGEILLSVQRDLYLLMAELSATPETVNKFRNIGVERIGWLEEQIEKVGESVRAPKEFILPGDSLSAAALALARTIVRRAERRIAGLILDGEIENEALLRYLNRLSSLCFALELLEIKAAGAQSATLAKQE